MFLRRTLFISTVAILVVTNQANAANSNKEKMPNSLLDGVHRNNSLGLHGLVQLPSILIGQAKIKCGAASFYGLGDGFHGRKTASGEVFNRNAMTAAHRSLPYGTRIRVFNKENGRAVVLKVNDNGPAVSGRILDLSYGAFAKIANPSQGIAHVCFSIA